MNTENKEIEIKFPLLNGKQTTNFLDENTEIISKKVYQKDTYFTPIHRDFLNYQYPYEWLRTRKSIKWDFINFKHFHPENTKESNYCDEYETKVEDLKIIEKIFEELNIEKRVVVEKERDTWMYKWVEIVIDNVTDLGYFIELELKKEFKSLETWIKYLHEILAEIKAEVWKQDFNWYPYLILEKQWFKFGN